MLQLGGTMIINKHYKNLQSISKNTKLVHTYFPSKYGFSPYQACQHGCKYCDGRAEKYYVEGDFERDIVIRENIPKLLQEQLPKLRERGTISISSGVSDPYQPVEAQERIMPQVAEILTTYSHSVSIMTKSSLILRDIDLWEKVHQKSGVILMISLTFLDDKLRQIFEPQASSVKKRLETIKAFKERGIYVGVLAMPFIPYISDSREGLLALVDKLAELEVDFVLPGGLTLRPGRQKDIFMSIIKDKFPQYLNAFKNLYRENRQSGLAISSYRDRLNREFNQIFSKLPMAVPHYLYQDQFPIYDELYILLEHMKELYSKKGVNTTNLEGALQRYTRWLLAEKKNFNRRRNLRDFDLEQKLLFLIHGGEFANIIKNDKLINFIKGVILERRTFDYLKLKLD